MVLSLRRAFLNSSLALIRSDIVLFLFPWGKIIRGLKNGPLSGPVSKSLFL
jgi:hypothetical protein